MAVLAAGQAAAQRAAPGEGVAHTEQLAQNLYSVNWGEMGLNVGVLAGPDGVLLIDDQEQAAVPRLRAEIAKISHAPVRYVINSHWHFDHVGGNAVFAQAGAVVIAQENTRARLMSAQVNPVSGEIGRAHV